MKRQRMKRILYMHGLIDTVHKILLLVFRFGAHDLRYECIKSHSQHRGRPVWPLRNAFENAYSMQNSNLTPGKVYSRFVPSPGSRFPLTANIFPVTPATKPSTCLVYCSTCLLFSILSNLDGSVGSLKSLCHSSSGSKGCFDNDRAAFSAFLFVCHCCILVCSLASARE
jgi:hypothetical protein